MSYAALYLDEVADIAASISREVEVEGVVVVVGPPSSP
jgi:hypothetical protein